MVVIGMVERPPHSFAEKFIRGNILNVFWNNLLGGLGLITSFLTLTALSVRDFGIYQLVLSVVLFLDVFSVNFFDEVVQNDITRAFGDKRNADAKRLFFEFSALKVGVSILVTITLFFSASAVAHFYDKDIGSYVRIISLVMVIHALQSVINLFLRSVVSLRAIGAGAVEEFSKLTLVAGLFFFSTLGIREVLFSTVIASLVAFIYLTIPFVREFKIFFNGIAAKPQFMFGPILKMYGFWILFRSATRKSAKPLRPWLIATLLNAEAVALYALATNLVVMIKNILPLLDSSLLAWEAANPSRLGYIFGRSAKYLFWGGMALALVGFLAVPPLVQLLFPKYLPAMPLFILFLLSVPIHGISRLESSLLTTFREQKLLASLFLTDMAISVAILVTFLPWLGVLAVGIETNSAILWHTWFLYRRMSRKYPFLRLNFRSFFRIDAEDRLIFRRGIIEVISFFRRTRQAVS
ncbi:MAG: oligosaccharide flippase family protein [Candidatus Sungbacteria bacterium]|nr:oligosaccharide flippase family protein [Candidatus Sungbacteria bacterium]